MSNFTFDIYIILLSFPLFLLFALIIVTYDSNMAQLNNLIIKAAALSVPIWAWLWYLGSLKKYIFSSYIVLSYSTPVEGSILFFFDDLTFIFLFLTALIIVLCMYYSINTQSREEHYVITALLLLLWFILNILFSVGHLLFFYIALEASLIPVLGLFIFSTRYRRLRAANFFFMYTSAFSYLLLMGIAQLWIWTGSYSYLDIKFFFIAALTEQQRLYLMVLFILCFFAKLPIYPLHTWLPEAHVEASTIGSVILASLMLKIGSYGLMRFVVSFFNAEIQKYLTILEFFIVLSIVYSTIVAAVQVDLKRIVAYSSILHMSFSVLGIFALDAYGKWGALFYSIGHTFTSAASFFLIGFLYRRFGTRLVKYYSGLSILPNLAGYMIFFTFANIGFPGTIGFVSELLIISSLVAKANWYILIFILFAYLFSLLSSVLLYGRLFFGVFNSNYLPVAQDLHTYEKNILCILAIGTVVLGFMPSLLTQELFIF